MAAIIRSKKAGKTAEDPSAKARKAPVKRVKKEKPAMVDLKAAVAGVKAPAPALKPGEALRVESAAGPAEKAAAKLAPAGPAEKSEFGVKGESAKQAAIKAINEEIKNFEEKAKRPAPVAPAPIDLKNNQPIALLEPAHKRPLSLYRRISISFIILTAILLSVVAYFSLVKAVITIVPKAENASGNMLLDVYDEQAAPAKDNSLVGAVRALDLKEEKSFSATGEKNLGEEVSGTARIVNNYNKNQPLVASTRLLAPDGKLFRIKDTVNVPANGSVEVEIYADKPGAEMAIPPTRFTIPGLWAGLQDKIYAQTDAKIDYQQKTQKFIQQIDIDNGVKDLKDGLLKQADAATDAAPKDKYGQLLYKVDDNSIGLEFGGKADEEKDSFTIKIMAKVIAVGFSREAAETLARQKLIADLSQEKELVEFNKDKIVYNLNSTDVEHGGASIEVNFEGTVMPRGESNIVDKQKLVGLSASQLDEYLASLPTIASFQVDFKPSFIRKVPNLADRIEVVIKK